MLWDNDAIQRLLDQAIQQDSFLKERYIQIEEYEALFQFAAGDARKALNLLDLIASTFEPDLENIINNAVVVINLRSKILHAMTNRVNSIMI